MKVIVLPLVGGNEATFFVGNNNLVVAENKDSKTCSVIDGLHNNGGWQIAKTYAQVVKQLREAYNA